MRQIQIVNNEIYHIYNRGTTKMNIFLSHADYIRFINKIYFYKEKYMIDILVFCLMPNHFHLLLRANNIFSNIPMFMKDLQCSHAKYFNTLYAQSGHVFQSPYKNKIVATDSQLSAVVRYILENPIRKKLVTRIKDWKYSDIIERKALIDLGVMEF